MPNCDFYSLREDHEEVLKFILTETKCRVFELYSAPGTEIREFYDVDEILTAYDAGVGPYRLLLNLYSPSMGGEFIFRRISLNPEKFGQGTFRYEAHGWGAIQLYLGGVHEGGLRPSHTNHNSEKRALVWAATISDLGSPNLWEWREVTSISSRINRFIRKIAVGKERSCPLLPAAFRWHANGGLLKNLCG